MKTLATCDFFEFETASEVTVSVIGLSILKVQNILQSIMLNIVERKKDKKRREKKKE